jgi:hypothetical protein
MLKTRFWRNAADSLPAAVRARYIAHFEAAERFDLMLDAVVDAWKLFVRQVPAPRPQAR